MGPSSSPASTIRTPTESSFARRSLPSVSRNSQPAHRAEVSPSSYFCHSITPVLVGVPFSSSLRPNTDRPSFFSFFHVDSSLLRSTVLTTHQEGSPRPLRTQPCHQVILIYRSPPRDRPRTSSGGRRRVDHGSFEVVLPLRSFQPYLLPPPDHGERP